MSPPFSEYRRLDNPFSGRLDPNVVSTFTRIWLSHIIPFLRRLDHGPQAYRNRWT